MFKTFLGRVLDLVPTVRQQVAAWLVAALAVALIPAALAPGVAEADAAGPVTVTVVADPHREGEIAAARRAADLGAQRCEDFGWGSDACDVAIDTVAAAVPAGAHLVADEDAARFTVVDDRR